MNIGGKGFLPFVIVWTQYNKKFMLTLRLYLLFILFLSFHALGLSDDTENYRFWIKDKSGFRENTPFIDDNKSIISENLEINFDGKKYKINNNVNEMGMAIYIALNKQQYADVTRLLPLYQNLKQHDILLVKFALAEIARSKRSYSSAIQNYKEILSINPNFLRVELELARTYFDDKQNNESLAQFNKVLDKYAQQLPPNVMATISQFTSALESQNDWKGSLSFGYGFNSNLNQVPGDGRQTCFSNQQTKYCYGARKRISDSKLAYDGNLNRTWPLMQNHNIAFKSYTYGYKYQKESDYNENITNLKVLYQYSDAKKSFSLGPVSEFKFVGDKNYYHGIGISLDTEYLFTSKFSLNTNLDYQKLTYRSPYQNNDGNKTNAYITGIYAIDSDFIIFGGIDSSLVNKKFESDSYKQYGVRLGLFKDYQREYQLMGMMSFKKTKFNDIAYMLNGKTRNDNEQLYLIKLSSPKYQILTFTPSINYKYRTNTSSADALYSYKQNEVEFKLEKRF
ncbi:surface lipoprotein assembly modifier [Providencia stuartii]|nr:surface lipoprotein assembly modifier [Providencia stuartii]